MALLSTFKIHIKCFKSVLICSNRKLYLNLAPTMNKYGYREAKMLNKLMGPPKKKRTYFEGSAAPVAGSKLNYGGGVKSSKENSRRITVLNSLFMKHISDLLVSSNIAEDVLGKGLEISNVAMAPNFNQLNVFWATNKEENLAALENCLPELGFKLRHELSQLRVMGIVPRIVFVKDKHYSTILKVNHLLSIADFGEDHKQIPFGSEFKNSEPVLFDKITTPAKKENSDKAAAEDTTTKTEEMLQLQEIMPVMRHDIFNLKHDYIMEKVIKSLQKSRALHRYHPNLEIDCQGSGNDWSQVPVENMTKVERKLAISKFILERKIVQEKRKQNKYNAELNVLVEHDMNNSADEDNDEFDEYEYDEYDEDFETKDCIKDGRTM